MALCLATCPGIRWGRQSHLLSPSIIQHEKRLKRSAECFCQPSLPAPLPNTPRFYTADGGGGGRGVGVEKAIGKHPREKYTIFILHSISRFRPDFLISIRTDLHYKAIGSRNKIKTFSLQVSMNTPGCMVFYVDTPLLLQLRARTRFRMIHRKPACLCLT